MGADRVDRTERLLNLVVCLMATRTPVSRERIFEVIPGYQDAQSPAALERMFERDKDDLRGLGVPLQTVLNAHGEVDGYRIALDEYVMPVMNLTSAERAVVQIAAAAWQGAILEPAATNALAKIDAQDPVDVPVMADDVFLHFNGATTALLQFMRALRLARSVRFDYRRPDQAEPGSRHMDPWGVVAHEGHWYAVGYDRDRGEPRMFRLSRINGNVRVLGEALAHGRPASFDIRAFVEGNDADTSRAEAIVWLQDSHAASVRRYVIDEVTDLGAAMVARVRAPSWEILRMQVSTAGKHAIALEPPEFRSSIVAGLESVLALHHDGQR
jgi:proteasome accessory factor B